MCCPWSEVLHWLRLRGSHSSTAAEFIPPTDWNMMTPFRHQECDHRHSARGTTPASPLTGAGCPRDKPKSRHMTGHTETSHRAPKYTSGRHWRQCPAFLSGEFACAMLSSALQDAHSDLTRTQRLYEDAQNTIFNFNFCRCRTFNPHCRGFLREDYVGLGTKWRIFTITHLHRHTRGSELFTG